jgi:hypothetical protein
MENNIRPMGYMKNESQMARKSFSIAHTMSWTELGKWISFSVLFLISSNINSQDSLSVSGLFEGKISYQYQITNPNPGLISDEEFYESTPNQGKSEFTLYVKGNRYRYEYPDRIEIFSPSMNQVSIQSLKNKDSVSYLNVNALDDSIKKVTRIQTNESVMGFSCEAIEVKAKWETRIFYYNIAQLKTNSNFWRNHQRDLLANYYAKSSNFPLLIIRKSMLGNFEIRALKIEKMSVSDDLFKLP